MPLNEAQARSAKPASKQYKLSDSGGLFLLVTPSGGKWWRLKYRYRGKEKLLSLGTYPQVGLKEARTQRDTAKKQLADGYDPSQLRQAEKLARDSAQDFEGVAREWHSRHQHRWSPKHATTILSRLERDIFPWIGGRPVEEIPSAELLAILRRIENQGKTEKAHRIQQLIGQVFRYAIAIGQAEKDPSKGLQGALAPAPQNHYPTFVAPQEVGELLRAIDGFSGSPQVAVALKLAPLTFVRPGELRHAEWSEFDLERAEWRIPALKMKRRNPHIVPLSKQAVTLLQEWHAVAWNSRYLFPSARTLQRPICNNAINAALRRLGFEQGEFVGHSFRSMASTLLYENGWDEELVERQLAHKMTSGVRGAYDFSKRLPERREMMQWWADFLDQLRHQPFNPAQQPSLKRK